MPIVSSRRNQHSEELQTEWLLGNTSHSDRRSFTPKIATKGDTYLLDGSDSFYLRTAALHLTPSPNQTQSLNTLKARKHVTTNRAGAVREKAHNKRSYGRKARRLRPLIQRDGSYYVVCVRERSEARAVAGGLVQGGGEARNGSQGRARERA
jgi:hypothetical protein